MNSLSMISTVENATSLSNISNAPAMLECEVVNHQLVNEKSEVGHLSIGRSHDGRR